MLTKVRGATYEISKHFNTKKILKVPNENHRAEENNKTEKFNRGIYQ